MILHEEEEDGSNHHVPDALNSQDDLDEDHACLARRAVWQSGDVL